MRLLDLTGRKFGKLTVTSRATNIKMKVSWNCICDCGKSKILRANDLLTGHTTACGCNHGKGIITHGESHSKEYMAWNSLFPRCYKKTHKAYKFYGARGITVCERWGSFSNFLQDMGRAPTKMHSIDRIISRGNYEPGNCRWATWEEQGNNKINSVMITHNGIKKSKTQWARHLGISYDMLHLRMKKGMSIPEIEKQLMTP